eukprot:3769443-Pyramimonas_sp.AAC.1
MAILLPAKSRGPAPQSRCFPKRNLDPRPSRSRCRSSGKAPPMKRSSTSSCIAFLMPPSGLHLNPPTGFE